MNECVYLKLRICARSRHVSFNRRVKTDSGQLHLMCDLKQHITDRFSYLEGHVTRLIQWPKVTRDSIDSANKGGSGFAQDLAIQLPKRLSTPTA